MIREAIDGISAPAGKERVVRAVSWMVLVLSHVIRLPMSFFGRTPTGDVMSRLTNDVSAVWLLLGPGALTLVGTAISYLLALLFMARISVMLTLVSLALAPVIVYTSREYGKAFHRHHRKAQESLAAMNSALQENITGIRLVKAYGLEEKEEDRFHHACREYYRQNVSVSKTSAAFHGAIGLLAGIGVSLVLLLGGWLVIRGSLTLGGFVAFNAYLAMLSFPTMALGWVINLVQRGGSAMGRINEFLGILGEPREPVLFPLRRSPYEEQDRGEALRGITFSLRKGEIIGLVGQTGSGKSTLFSLLLRLHPVPPGTVFLEGRDVSGIPLDEIRRAVRVVSQDPFLFSDTVLENICFGRDVPNVQEARSAASMARFLAEIEEMPDGMDTVIGERGISLSGGQKQRASFSTTPSPRSTRRRSGKSSGRSSPSGAARRSCSARTGWLPSPGATGSWFSREEGSWRKGPTTSCSPWGGRITISIPGRCSGAGSGAVSNGAEFYFYEDRVETRGMDMRLLRRLLSYLVPHKGLIAVALAGLVLGTACQLAGPYIIKLVIDRNITPRVLDGMAGRIALYLAALAGAMGFLYLQMFTVSNPGRDVRQAPAPAGLLLRPHPHRASDDPPHVGCGGAPGADLLGPCLHHRIRGEPGRNRRGPVMDGRSPRPDNLRRPSCPRPFRRAVEEVHPGGEPGDAEEARKA
jgi:ABC-type multidrug transport system fused ATPase/permease subunit